MKIASPARREQASAFTLIELLTVIAIIAVLMGLLFPAVNAVKESARKTQAKNDLVNIVNAVKAYYTEYGKYPLTAGEQGSDQTFGASGTTNDNLFNVLRANGEGRDTLPDNLNPRRIVFMEVPTAKNATVPKSGIGPNDGKFYDPWGSPYSIRIDGSYDNKCENPYSSGAGFNPVETGVIGWSLGKDKVQGSTDFSKSDDVVSWQ